MKRFCSLLSLIIAVAFVFGADTPKARLLSAPRPVKSREASSRHLAGRGLFLLHLDIATGRVTSIEIQKSTGQPLLDDCAVTTLRQWRAATGTARSIRLPIIFTALDDAARY